LHLMVKKIGFDILVRRGRQTSFSSWSDEGVRPVFRQMHPDALCVRTQVYHSAKKIVTLFSEIIF
jgi:hypothetical protein